MTVWRVIMDGRDVQFGNKKRRRLTEAGCNEPFKQWYWCPRKRWFHKTPCPFMNRRECENYRRMCGNY